MGYGRTLDRPCAFGRPIRSSCDRIHSRRVAPRWVPLPTRLTCRERRPLHHLPPRAAFWAHASFGVVLRCQARSQRQRCWSATSTWKAGARGSKRLTQGARSKLPVRFREAAETQRTRRWESGSGERDHHQPTLVGDSIPSGRGCCAKVPSCGAWRFSAAAREDAPWRYDFPR
jgi:hypothetical protein